MYGKYPEDQALESFSFLYAFSSSSRFVDVHDVAVREGIIIAFDLADLP